MTEPEMQKEKSDERLSHPNMPPETSVQPRGCRRCCACIVILPLGIFVTMIAVTFVWSLIFPLRFWAENVEDHDIPNILQELAGEWGVDIHESTSAYYEEDWKSTRLVLHEDGTCEFHNPTLYMTNPNFSEKRRPELTGKTLIGTWVSSPEHVSFGGGAEKVYAAIWVKVHATEPYLVEHAEKFFVEPTKRSMVEREFYLPLGMSTMWDHEIYAHLGVWKWKGKYQLYWISVDPDCGIDLVMKRSSSK